MPIRPTGKPLVAPLKVVLSYRLSNAIYRFGIWLADLLSGPHRRWDDELSDKVHGHRCPVPILKRGD